MTKKRGSILLESLISIVIIMIIGSIVLGFTITLNSSKKVREDFDFYERVSYSVENEIKYNIEYDEILDLLSSERNISFNLNKNYFIFILENDLLTLERGNGIVIKKISSSENRLLELEICIYNTDNKLVVSRNFIKGDI